jgi:hypothetical protein
VQTIQFKKDLTMTEKTLMDVAGLSVAEEQKNFYDYLHFSPVKVNKNDLRNCVGLCFRRPLVL